MSSETLTWDDVLARQDLIGGDMESQEDGDIYRGPLSSIKKEGDLIYFELKWCARLKIKGENGWERWDFTTSFFNMKYATPSDIGDGRITFQVPLTGPVVIFPKGGSKLDPSRVEGLDIQE